MSTFGDIIISMVIISGFQNIKKERFGIVRGLDGTTANSTST